MTPSPRCDTGLRSAMCDMLYSVFKSVKTASSADAQRTGYSRSTMREFFRGWRRKTEVVTHGFRVYCAILAWSVWIGGFMFYFGVVVPVGGGIVGGSEQGFVTQHVTFRLNLIGAASLSILAWNSWAAKSRLLVVTVVLMSLCHAALFTLHHWLDLMIVSREIADQVRFASLHESYEGISTVQWIAAMAHLIGIVRGSAWQRELPPT